MKKQDGRICIILLNWNGKKDTLECLASLEKIKYKRFQTIVVDNGSTDGSVEVLRNIYPEIVILETKENLGFAGGNNVGIQWAMGKKFEWIFLLNNDTTVKEDLLDALIEASQQKNAKILGAKIYRYYDPETIDHLGGFWNPKIAEFESPAQGKKETNGDFHEMQEVDYVSGCALLLHREVIEKIDLLEPNFFLYWEETDYCFRARKAGFPVWTAPKAHVYHKVSTSFTGGKAHMHYFWWRSRLLWMKRNCTKKEKHKLYRKVILPELFKTLRHLCLKSLQYALIRSLGRKSESHKEKIRRYRAGLSGALHYLQNRFGNCPSWITARSQQEKAK